MKRTNKGVAHVILLLVCAISLIPVYWMLRSAIAQTSSIFGPTLQFWPAQFEWSNFASAWRAEPFGIFFFNSIASNLIIVACQMVTSALAAYALVFLEFRFKQWLFFVILLGMMVPMQATFIPIYKMLSMAHLINTYGALVLPFVGSAFGVFMLRQAFMSFPKEIARAARIDGANEMRILWCIVLPNAKPALITLVLLNFVYHYNALFWPLVATNTVNMRVVPVALSYFLSQDAGQGMQWNLMMASAAMAIVPVILLFLVGQRYFVEGVTGFANKS